MNTTSPAGVPVRPSLRWRRALLRLSAWVWLGWCASAQALSPSQAHRIATGDFEVRQQTVLEAVLQEDTALGALLDALEAGTLRSTDTHTYRVLDGSGAAGPSSTVQAVEVGTERPVPLPPQASEVLVNNRMRGLLQWARAALALQADDADARRVALSVLASNSSDGALTPLLPLLERSARRETVADLRDALEHLMALARLDANDAALRLEAVRRLGDSGDPQIRSLLQQRLAPGVETDPGVRAALARAVGAMDARLAWGERLGVAFTGLSLGSLLLLVALGLAVTYGLMGVINMAHGELMMVGAYATWLVQGAFRQWWPNHFDWYVVAALPVAFTASAVLGAVLERSVIRWLYGRPLETLLATWGISLILMQGARSLFGAQNVPLENPAWMSGGWAVLPNLTLPYNRLVILLFAALVLGGVALLIARTRLGLEVRGVTQNRRMAACMGVHTARVDTLAFALGSGIAGLAGCALSQIGNVGPDLGQSYIVDAFMVVVLGGVGQLAGTVWASLGLGLLSKWLESGVGAVLAKIAVLVFIVLFIQKRPQGLFALKGRSAEAG